MPSVSEKQRRFMLLASKDTAFARKNKIPQSVAKEFVAADEAKAPKRKPRRKKKK